MTDKTQSPFVPGARVAIVWHGFEGRTYTAAFVEKVHKSGRFTLRDHGAQQWRPDPWCARTASASGERFSRRSLVIWDAETDAEISASLVVEARRNRWRAIVDRVRSIRNSDVTDAMCDAIEAALPAPKAGQ